jgi:putative glutamine amidotransferase
VRKLAGSQHAPADWVFHAQMIVRSWAGLRTTAIAAEIHCHPQTVRERIQAFNERGLDGLVIPGGEDVSPGCYGETPHAHLGRTNAARDQAEIALVLDALKRRMPLLGICRGLQIINVALGGTLYQDIADQVPGTLKHAQWNGPRNRIAHLISIAPGTLLREALGTTTQRVNSLHHQAVHALGRGVRVTAQAPDGVIEGIEIEGHPWAVAVQYHPEELAERDPAAAGLFAALIAAARRSDAALALRRDA